MSGLRVLHLIHALSMGGGEYHLVQDARGMAGRGVDVRVIARADNTRLCAALAQAGVPVTPVELVPVPVLGGAIAFGRTLLEQAKNFRPDIVCTNTLTTALVGAFLKPRLAAKLVYAIMVIRHNRRLVPLLRFIFARLDGVLYNSRYTRDCYHALVPNRLPEAINFSTVDDPRPRLLPPEQLARLRAELLGDGSRLVGFVGRLHPEKGVIDFLHMAEILHRQNPSLRFVLLGAKDAKHPDCAEEAYAFAAERLGGAVRFLDHLPDAASHIAVMDCLVNPTYGEGFGRVALEAAYLGTPIVATAPGGMTEILDGYGKARMAPWHRPDLLAEGVDDLLTCHPWAPQRQGDAGVIARFAPAALLDIELDFFHRLMEKGGA